MRQYNSCSTFNSTPPVSGQGQTRRALLAALFASGLAGCASVPDAGPQPQVLLETTAGDIRVELDPQHAPKSVANFLRYVREGQYDGTIFHRVIAGFVVQGGGYDTALHEKPMHAPIPLEAGRLSNVRGTLAMARDDGPDTATDEFYFNLVDNLKLDPHPENPARRYGYAVFGHVVAGMDVVDHMATARTVSLPPFDSDFPQPPVVLLHALVLPASR